MIAGGPPPGWRTHVPRLFAVLVVLVGTGLVAFLVSLGLNQVSVTGRSTVTLPRAASPTPSPPSLSDIGRKALSRVVTVEAERSSNESLGTAWLIDSDCDFVTNAHVIYGAQTLRITDRSDHTHTVSVAGVDESQDIALLHCTDGYQPGSALPVAAAALTTTPAPMVVLASGRATGQADLTLESLTALHQDVPLANSDAESDPQAPSVYHDMLDLTGARIYQGNSGGPVLDAAGSVVGIVTLSSPGSDEAFAIPLSRVLAELQSFERRA
ncbi:MAG: serine protease [Candidatus Dormibacteraeota bacterium]|nr:serine protease [Candidatus Dormibacteraeota bacterium]